MCDAIDHVTSSPNVILFLIHFLSSFSSVVAFQSLLLWIIVGLGQLYQEKH